MSSPEAELLASSVEDANVEGSQQGESSHWNTMATTTATSSMDGGMMREQRSSEARQSLVNGPGRRSHTNKNKQDDDIYEYMDQAVDDEDDEDEFLDRPLWEVRGSALGRLGASAQRGLHKIYVRLYGDLPVSEMLRTLCLASTLLFLIGGYWTLRSLKDTIVMAVNGVEYIPIAKMVSVGVIVVVVPLYNGLLDSGMPRHHLFYLIGSVYFGIFSCIAMLLKHPTIGLDNQQMDPYRILGWVSYCTIESFGSIMVSLFWSFANSNFSFKTAKASYGVMVATGQIGSILGPTLVNAFSLDWGLANL